MARRKEQAKQARSTSPHRFPRIRWRKSRRPTPRQSGFKFICPPTEARQLRFSIAQKPGYRAIVLTIDTVVASNRETDTRNHFRSPFPLGNFPGENGAYAAAPIKRDLDWDDVEFTRKTTGLPVLLKGVMSPELAVAAAEHGCAGIQVSNHGGRQLDDVAASITVLPRIADAVRGRAIIVIDGGIRRGQDVFKALALGANAVAIGRPILYGLALGGWMGVQAVLKHLDGELEMTMRLAGARTIAEISRRFVATGVETSRTV